MRPLRDRIVHSREAVVVIVLAASVLVAVLSASEAVEERRTAAAAKQLQMAAIEVAHADVLTGLGGEPDLSLVSTSLKVLTGDHEEAYHALAAEEVATVDLLISEIVGCGNNLLADSEGNHTPAHHHRELEQLLGEATTRAARSAAGAERWALTAVAGVVLALILAGSTTTRSRLRSAKAGASAQAQVREGHRLQTLLNGSPDCLFVVDPSGKITYRSESCVALLAALEISLADVVALASKPDQATMRDHLTRTGSDNLSLVLELTRPNGVSGWFDMRVSDLNDDELVSGFLVSARDITTETRLRHQLEYQASTDDLTGLPNRRVLQPRLEAAQSQMGETDKPMGLLVLDIDGFKGINDTLGHPIGDELLIKVAARLNKAVRSEETLLRMGGDEFALILPSVSDEVEAMLVAERILDALRDPFTIADRSEHVRSSIGVAVTADPAQSQALIGRSDLALYEAKRLGGGRAVLHETAFEARAGRHAQIVRGLREADYDTEFSLVFQPIVDTAEGRTVALEALLRWASPELGSVGPAEFIPIAEVSGEVCHIGKWVFENVCRQVATLVEVGVDPELRVSFNVSARQLAEPDFVPWLLDTIRHWNIPAGRLIAEVTESAALDHTGVAQRRLHQLREAGLLISIDDFGAGYSNLGQLISVPFDIIKVDRSLLLTLSAMREEAGGDPAGPCSIMQAIVSIASTLNAPVVCEGVETEQQRSSLQASGITHIQGYLVGRPAPPAQLVPELIGWEQDQDLRQVVTELIA